MKESKKKEKKKNEDFLLIRLSENIYHITTCNCIYQCRADVLTVFAIGLNFVQKTVYLLCVQYAAIFCYMLICGAYIT